MNVDPQATYFLDTNILVYAYDRSAGQKHKRASGLVKACWEHENGCLSIQVLQEFFVTVTRKIAASLEHAMARQIVSDLAQWRLHTPEAADLLQAIDLQQNYHLAFWDAQVIQSAANLGCQQLISEDFNHGQRYGEVQVINPFEDED
jgi:predicted nucleic acid-binding protein